MYMSHLLVLQSRLFFSCSGHETMSLTRGCSSYAHIQQVQIINSRCPHDNPFLRDYKSWFQDQTFFISEVSGIHPVTDLRNTQQIFLQLNNVVNSFKRHNPVG
ncbi:hypothetical protein HanIR_Chr02g0052521 [Helianthus annuus]|nr:hypothetical protein HanIR_Chr02g0052521 [Helianthus annuus]